MIRRLLLILVAFVIPNIAKVLWSYGIGEGTRALNPQIDYSVYRLSAPPHGVQMSELGIVDKTLEQVSVAFDLSRNNTFRMSEVQSVVDLLAARNAQVKLISKVDDASTLERQLLGVDAFVVVCPIESFTELETLSLQRFVNDGGKLVVISDPTRLHVHVDVLSGKRTITSDVAAANSILSRFDIRVHDDYLYNVNVNEGNFRNVFFSRFAKHSLTHSLSRVAMYGANSLSTTSGTVLISSDQDVYSSRNDSRGIHAVAILSSNERVLALGDLTLFTAPYEETSDNARFIGNIVKFLTERVRPKRIREFPMMFDDTVSFRVASALAQDKDIIRQLSKVQQKLVKKTHHDQKRHDDILLSLFSSQELRDWNRSGDLLQAPESLPEMLRHEFGFVPSAEVGLIQLSHTDGSTRMRFLAGNVESIKQLTEKALSGDLSGCLVRTSTRGVQSTETAICSLLDKPTNIDATVSITDTDPVKRDKPKEPR